MKNIKPMPKHVYLSWDKQIKGFFDCKKRIKPTSNDPHYLHGYDAAGRGETFSDRVIQYIHNGI